MVPGYFKWNAFSTDGLSRTTTTTPDRCRGIRSKPVKISIPLAFHAHSRSSRICPLQNNKLRSTPQWRGKIDPSHYLNPRAWRVIFLSNKIWSHLFRAFLMMGEIGAKIWGSELCFIITWILDTQAQLFQWVTEFIDRSLSHSFVLLND
jgi:hypothetical protein